MILRFGWLYGPGTYYAPGGSVAEEVRKRRYPVVGPGTGTFSYVHVEDAAAAVVAALDHGSPGAYNVVDDEPAPLCEWLPGTRRRWGRSRRGGCRSGWHGWWPARR